MKQCCFYLLVLGIFTANTARAAMDCSVYKNAVLVSGYSTPSDKSPYELGEAYIAANGGDNSAQWQIRCVRYTEQDNINIE